MSQLSKEERERKIAALLRERDGYRRTGRNDRAKEVDEQLRVYGHKEESDKDTRKEAPQGRSERDYKTVSTSDVVDSRDSSHDRKGRR